MKKLLTLLAIIGLLASCGESGTKTCISKLQLKDKTVYSIDAFNYIVYDSIHTYHYIAASRYCGDMQFTIIKIK